MKLPELMEPAGSDVFSTSRLASIKTRDSCGASVPLDRCVSDLRSVVCVNTGRVQEEAQEIVSLYAYKTLFQYLDFGRGSAATVVMAIVTTTLSIVYIKTLSGHED